MCVLHKYSKLLSCSH